MVADKGQQKKKKWLARPYKNVTGFLLHQDAMQAIAVDADD